MLFDYNGIRLYDGSVDNGILSIPVRNGVYVLSINGSAIRILIK